MIHPYSDFLLHDIGTGDGIPVQPTCGIRGNGQPDSDRATMGPSDRSRLMHDGLTFTRQEAIRRHARARRQAVGAAHSTALTAEQQAAAHRLPQFVVTVRGRAASAPASSSLRHWFQHRPVPYSSEGGRMRRRRLPFRSLVLAISLAALSPVAYRAARHRSRRRTSRTGSPTSRPINCKAGRCMAPVWVWRPRISATI